MMTFYRVRRLVQALCAMLFACIFGLSSATLHAQPAPDQLRGFVQAVQSATGKAKQSPHKQGDFLSSDPGSLIGKFSNPTRNKSSLTDNRFISLILI